MTGGHTVDEEGASRAGPPETVRVDGNRTMAYATYGAAEGAPVVFFHGTPGSRVLGEVFAEAARSRDACLVAVDRPGYGRTPPWPDRSPAEVARGVECVLADLGTARTGVAAFSGGAPYAFALAERGEVDVERIDVVAGTVPPSLRSSTPAAQRLLAWLATGTPRLFGALAGGQTWLADRGPASMVTGQYTTGDSATEVPDGVAETVRRDFVEANRGGAAGFAAEFASLDRKWTVPEDLEAPVRLWHGDCDANVPIDGARALADGRAGVELTVLEDADHLGALIEARDPVLEAQAHGE